MGKTKEKNCERSEDMSRRRIRGMEMKKRGKRKGDSTSWRNKSFPPRWERRGFQKGRGKERWKGQGDRMEWERVRMKGDEEEGV